MSKKIYENGIIITLDKNETICNTMVVEDDKIVFIGDKSELKEADFLDADIINLENKCIIPGFYDSHGHIVGNAVVRWDLNKPIYPIGTTKSIKEIITAGKEVAETKSADDWIVIINFDEGTVEENRGLTKEDLDEISLNNPVAVGNRSGHVLYLNTKALEVCGITKETPNIPGGVYQKDEKTGELTGAIEEKAALFIAHKFIPKPTLEQLISIIKDVGDEYVSRGITTANDAGFMSQGMMFQPILENVIENGIFLPKASVTHGYDFNGVDEFIEKIKALKPGTQRLHTYNAFKCFYDGSIQAHTAYVSENYPNTDTKGYSILTKEQLAETIMKVHKENMSFIVHVNGDKAVEDVLECIEKAEEKYGKKDVRHMLIHAQMITEKQLDKAKELGVFVTFLNATIYYLGDEYLINKYIDEEKLMNLDPAKWAVDRKMPFALHADAQVYPANPLLLMDIAVNRRTYRNTVIGSEQQISKVEALKALTYYPAYQNMEQDVKGSLEVGKFADFVILAENILEVENHKIKDVEILSTVIDGKVVYDKK